MTRPTLLTALAAALICGAGAVAEDFSLVREGHPRLELTADEIAELRSDTREIDRVRGAADRFLQRGRTQIYQEYFVSLPQPGFPPEHTDGWPYWTGLTGELRSALETTALAGALTGERKYIRWCRELMLAVAHWRQWTDPWYGEQPGVDTHHIMRGMCVAVDLLWQDLSEEERATVVEAIAQKGAEFIYQASENDASYLAAPGQWPNGYAMINTELGVAGLTLLGEHERADAWLARSLEKARLFFEEQGGVEGGLVEGFGYGSAAVDNLVYLARAADKIAGIDLIRHPYLAKAITFPAYFVVPGGGSLANFGDSGGPTGVQPTLLDLAEAMVEVEQNSLAAWYLRTVGESGPHIARLARQPDLPTAKHFRDIDWVAMRSGWNDSGSLLAFKSGRVEHHNHLDQNSFILAWNDEWLLNDPGHQVYDRAYPPDRNMTEEVIANRHAYTYGTIGHNAILVDGEGQIAARGHVTKFASTPAMDYAAGDASACYEGLEGYVRHVVSLAPDYHVIFDEIATGGGPRGVEVLLHTTPDGTFEIGGRELPVGESREGRECAVRRSGEAVARFVQPDRLLFKHRQHPDCTSYGHYLSALAPGVRDETIAWVLAAGPAGEVEVEARAVDGVPRAVQVRAGSAMDTIALGGDEPVEAGLVTFSGQAAMVRDSRAGVHRYALVEGTTLRLGIAEMVAADASVTVGALLEEKRMRVDITCAEPATVTMFCPVEPDRVRVTGIDAPVDVSFDKEAGAVTLDLPAGHFTLEVRAV